MNALVLAGDRNTIPLYPGHEPGPKALLRYGGKSSLEYVLEALEKVNRIKEICVVGSESLSEEIRAVKSYTLLSRGETMADSIVKGLDYFTRSQAVLVTTSDLPLITEEAVNDFLNKVGPIQRGKNQEFFISVVAKQSFTGLYRKIKKGFIRFRDVSVCHGNVMVLHPEIRKNVKFIRTLKKLYKKRKSAPKSAVAIGPVLALAFFFGMYLSRALTISQVARLISWRLDIKLAPVLMEHPEITVDVDEPEDYLFVKEQLEGP
jgi:molybdopterin-guanine dinucleotide biosynthesis protein A